MQQRATSLESTVSTLQAELASLRAELPTVRRTPLWPTRPTVVPPASHLLGQLPRGVVGQTVPPSRIALTGSTR